MPPSALCWPVLWPVTTAQGEAARGTAQGEATGDVKHLTLDMPTNPHEIRNALDREKRILEIKEAMDGNNPKHALWLINTARNGLFCRRARADAETGA